MADVFTTIFLLIGTAFLFLAAVAALRLPDVYCRLSGSTKAVTFGASSMFIAAAIAYGGTPTMTRAIAGIIFFFATSPVAAHVMARVSHMRGIPLWEGSIIDETEPYAPLGHSEPHGAPASGGAVPPESVRTDIDVPSR